MRWMLDWMIVDRMFLIGHQTPTRSTPGGVGGLDRAWALYLKTCRHQILGLAAAWQLAGSWLARKLRELLDIPRALYLRTDGIRSSGLAGSQGLLAGQGWNVNTRASLGPISKN